MAAEIFNPIVMRDKYDAICTSLLHAGNETEQKKIDTEEIGEAQSA